MALEDHIPPVHREVRAICKENGWDDNTLGSIAYDFLMDDCDEATQQRFLSALRFAAIENRLLNGEQS